MAKRRSIVVLDVEWDDNEGLHGASGESPQDWDWGFILGDDLSIYPLRTELISAYEVGNRND